MSGSAEEQMAALVKGAETAEILPLAVSTSTVWVDLQMTALGQNAAAGARTELIFRGRFITIQADGGDVYYALTKDSTTALLPGATGTTLPVVGACMVIKDGTKEQIFIPGAGSAPTAGPASGGPPTRYLAFVCKAGASSTVRIAPSSQAMAR